MFRLNEHRVFAILGILVAAWMTQLNPGTLMVRSTWLAVGGVTGYFVSTTYARYNRNWILVVCPLVFFLLSLGTARVSAYFGSDESWSIAHTLSGSMAFADAPSVLAIMFFVVSLVSLCIGPLCYLWRWLKKS